MNALMSPMLLVNTVFILMALFVPQIKDLLSPEFEIALVASINGVVAIIERMKK